MVGIEREYEELDTVWFMAGSLFKVKGKRGGEEGEKGGDEREGGEGCNRYFRVLLLQRYLMSKMISQHIMYMTIMSISL